MARFFGPGLASAFTDREEVLAIILKFFFHGGHISSPVKNMTTIIEMEGPF